MEDNHHTQIGGEDHNIDHEYHLHNRSYIIKYHKFESVHSTVRALADFGRSPVPLNIEHGSITPED